jgi:hypothetical protein
MQAVSASGGAPSMDAQVYQIRRKSGGFSDVPELPHPDRVTNRQRSLTKRIAALASVSSGSKCKVTL